MLTKQHVAITVLAMIGKKYRIEDIEKVIPYLLLPDAIRMYVGRRQPSHFEVHPNGDNGSWMIFPEGEALKKLNKENAREISKWHVAENILEAVICEEIDIAAFEKFNSTHDNFRALKCHLLQDSIMDKALREELIYDCNRFEDKFTVRHSLRVINGKELREQITLFEELGFIHLIGTVWDSVGVLLDKDWFDNHVQKALYDAYGAEMARNTYSYMQISDEVDRRLKAHNFKLTEEEKASVYIAEDLTKTLNAMYVEAGVATLKEF